MAHHVRRIAHLSDLHLLAHSNTGVSAGDTVRKHFVSLGRAVDPARRASVTLAALRRARRLGADHLVISGDLTELGLLSEMEVLAALLSDSGFAPDETTLVPGNHDRYAGAENWARALSGVLLPWATNAPREAGTCVDLGSVRLLPLDVTRAQSVLRSAGFVTSSLIEGLGRRITDASMGRVPIAVVLHHPPFALPPIVHHVDGLIGWERLVGCVSSLGPLQFLHGHLHKPIDRDLREGLPRVMGAPSLLQGEHAFRLYDVVADGLLPVDVVAAAA